MRHVGLLVDPVVRIGATPHTRYIRVRVKEHRGRASHAYNTCEYGGGEGEKGCGFKV